MLHREPDNEHDKSAVAVYGQNGKIGYVANSPKTVRTGCFSATQLCKIIKSPLKAVVIEGTYNDALCRVLDVFDTDKVILKAFEFYNSGDYKSALPLYLELCKEFDSLFLLQYTADCLIKLEQFDEALKYIRSALDAEQDNKVTLMMYAAICESKNDYRQAADIYTKILEFGENHQVREILNKCIEKM